MYQTISPHWKRDFVLPRLVDAATLGSACIQASTPISRSCVSILPDAFRTASSRRSQFEWRAASCKAAQSIFAESLWSLYIGTRSRYDSSELWNLLLCLIVHMERPPFGEPHSQNQVGIERQMVLAREAYELSEGIIEEARDAIGARTAGGEPIDGDFVLVEVVKAASQWRKHFLRSHGIPESVARDALSRMSGNREK